MERNQKMKAWLIRYSSWVAWCFYGSAILVSSLTIQSETLGQSALTLEFHPDGTVIFLSLIYELFLFWLLMQWLADEIVERHPMALLRMEDFNYTVATISVLSLLALLGMAVGGVTLGFLSNFIPKNVLASVVALLPSPEALATVVGFFLDVVFFLLLISLPYVYVVQHSVFSIPLDKRLTIYSDFLTGQLEFVVRADGTTNNEKGKHVGIDEVTRVFRDCLKLANDEFYFNHGMKIRNISRFVAAFQLLVSSTQQRGSTRLAELTRNALLSAGSLGSPFDFVRNLDRITQELDLRTRDLSEDIESPSDAALIADMAGRIPLLRSLILFFLARLL